MNLVPGVALGPVRLGETRQEHRSLLGEPTRTFRRTPEATSDTHMYEGIGLFLSYDVAETLAFAESFGALVSMGDVPLTGRLLADVQRDLEALGFVGTDDEAGCQYKGFGLYAPLRDVESVSLGSDG